MAENEQDATAGAQHTARTEKPRGQRKTRIGYVVSDKMQKTIVVELENRSKHPLYGKIIRTTTKVRLISLFRGPRRAASAWWPTADASPSATPGRRCLRCRSHRAP